MRKQNCGIIVNISSSAGRFGFLGGSAYVSTKFAVEGLSEYISYELVKYSLILAFYKLGGKNSLWSFLKESLFSYIFLNAI
jgi:hypothetical protein